MAFDTVVSSVSEIFLAASTEKLKSNGLWKFTLEKLPDVKTIAVDSKTHIVFLIFFLITIPPKLLYISTHI
jgi:hypothetical protein